MFDWVLNMVPIRKISIFKITSGIIFDANNNTVIQSLKF